jgi:hypothetical protein
MAEYDLFTYGDYSGQENFVLQADTVAPELPVPYIAPKADYISSLWGTSPTPVLQEIPRSEGTGVSGVLGQIGATASGLLSTWGKIATIENSIASQKLANDMQRSQIDLARAKGAASVAIETAKAEIQIKNAAAIAAAQTSPKSTLSGPMLIGLGLMAYKILGTK